MLLEKSFSRLSIAIFSLLLLCPIFYQRVFSLAISEIASNDSEFNGGSSSVCTSIWIHVTGIKKDIVLNGGLGISVDGYATGGDSLASLDPCNATGGETYIYGRCLQFAYCWDTTACEGQFGQSDWTIDPSEVTDSTIIICNTGGSWNNCDAADTSVSDLDSTLACFSNDSDDIWVNVFSGSNLYQLPGNPGFFNGNHTVTVTQYYAVWTTFGTNIFGCLEAPVNYYLLSSVTASAVVNFQNTLPGVNECAQSVDSSIEPTFCKLGVCLYPYCFARNSIYMVQNDITMSGNPGLYLNRAYNVRQPLGNYNTQNGFYSMGYGWWSEYSQTIEDNFGWVNYYDETGRKIYFQRTTPYVLDYIENGSIDYYSQETEYVLTKSYIHAEAIGDTLGWANTGTYALTRGGGGCCTGQEVLQFDPKGRLVSITDSNNNFINVSYSDYSFNPLLTTLSNSKGQVIKLHRYNTGDETTKIQYAEFYNSNDTSPTIKTVYYNYDSYDNLTSITNSAGQVASFIYSNAANHQLTQYIGINGATTNWIFNNNGVCTNTNVNNKFDSLTYQYQPDKHLTIQSDDSGNQVIYFWQNNGIVTMIIHPDNSTTQQFPDQYNNITTAINENGDTTNMFYDAYSNLTTDIDYAGNTTQYLYNVDFKICTTFINAAGQQYNFLLDGYGNITTMIFPDTSRWNAYYDNSGNLITLVNPLGYASNYFYDVYGNPSAFQDPLGNQSFTFYDSFGNLTATINALSQRADFQYDTLDRVTAILMPLSRKSYFSYNQTYNPISVIDPMGHQSQFQYDSLDRLTSTLSAASTSINKYYDNYSRLTTLLDENGNPTLYQYDSSGRLIKNINAAGNYSQVFYDIASQVTSARKPDGTAFPTWYDTLGRVTAYTHGNPIQSAGLTTTFLWYDVLGNLTTVYDITQGYTRYYYDVMGRITNKSYSTYTVSYAYDVLGRETGYLDPQGNRFRYVYDADNRLSKLINWANQTTSYFYDALGEMTAEYYPNHTRTFYSYDALGSPVSMQFSDITSIRYSPLFLVGAGSKETSANYGLQMAVGSSVIGRSTSIHTIVHWGVSQAVYINSSTLQVLSFAYDSVGNRTLQVDLANNSTFYFYDSLYRLTTEQRIGTNTYNRIYSYDSAGNRTQMYILSDSTSTSTYILNNLNQITASTTNGIETLYSYDANGNLLSKESTSYLWNKDDQLITVFLNNDTVSYLYDSLGRRSQRIHGNTTTNYQLEGLDTQIELDNNTVQRIYTLSGGLTGQIISVRYNGDDYFYHYDTWGNVLFITDSSAAIVSSYIQESFGNVLDKLNGLSIQFNLQSEYQECPPNYYHLNTTELDPVTGLYHCQSRWYDPTSGTWICNDYYKYSSHNSNSNNNPNSLILKPIPIKLDPEIINLIISFSMPGGNEELAEEGLLSKICKIKYIPIWSRTFLGKGTLGVAKEGYGFTSFNALKKYLGDPGPNNVWHHIVEQREPNILRFKACNIHNTENVIAVDNNINQKIADYYSSKQWYTQGKSLREWLNDQSYEEHYKRGIEMLKIFGVLK